MNLMTPFEILYKEETVHVLPRKIGRDLVYIIDFPSRRPPIMLTKAIRHGGGHFWTTIPEARDKKAQGMALMEAAVIGRLITEHYQKASSSVA